MPADAGMLTLLTRAWGQRREVNEGGVLMSRTNSNVESLRDDAKAGAAACESAREDARENAHEGACVGAFESARAAVSASMPGNGSVLVRKAAYAIREHDLATADTPVLLMVSGGSDSTALAYLARELNSARLVGPLAMLHVNHQLRGEDANEDARFVQQLAQLLDIPLFLCEVDVAAEVRRTGGNMEAIARHERYVAAGEALQSLCAHVGVPVSEGRIFTAHTADDRVESFYMRSIVGTGPGGFRSMRYLSGNVARPLMDAGREDLRGYVEGRASLGLPVARDPEGNLWREDATNAHTDHFRAYVRHEIVPRSKVRNPQLLDVLGRTMNLIADEDDFMESLACEVAKRCVSSLGDGKEDGFLLAPSFGAEPLPLRRRVCMRALQGVLGADARVETASVNAVLDAFEDGEGLGKPIGGYVTNIQGNLAVSANKQGVRVEPMAAFRARRKRK